MQCPLMLVIGNTRESHRGYACIYVQTRKWRQYLHAFPSARVHILASANTILSDIECTFPDARISLASPHLLVIAEGKERREGLIQILSPQHDLTTYAEDIPILLTTTKHTKDLPQRYPTRNFIPLPSTEVPTVLLDIITQYLSIEDLFALTRVSPIFRALFEQPDFWLRRLQEENAEFKRETFESMTLLPSLRYLTLTQVPVGSSLYTPAFIVYVSKHGGSDDIAFLSDYFRKAYMQRKITSRPWEYFICALRGYEGRLHEWMHTLSSGEYEDVLLALMQERMYTFLEKVFPEDDIPQSLIDYVREKGDPELYLLLEKGGYVIRPQDFREALGRGNISIADLLLRLVHAGKDNPLPYLCISSPTEREKKWLESHHTHPLVHDALLYCAIIHDDLDTFIRFLPTRIEDYFIPTVRQSAQKIYAYLLPRISHIPIEALLYATDATLFDSLFSALEKEGRIPEVKSAFEQGYFHGATFENKLEELLGVSI